jgi:hypothetical protein
VTEDTAAATEYGTVPGQRERDLARADRETKDHVKVCLPAEGAYLSVLRTATAGLAARLETVAIVLRKRRDTQRSG